MKELPRLARTILLADDEPYNLSWAEEYLSSKRYEVETATTVDEALRRLQRNRFRVVVADLSIPFQDPHQWPRSSEPLLEKYPGLVIAEYARNHGHLDRQVIVYSVHDDPLVVAHSSRLGITYMLKGRPRQFKDELDSVLSYDPLES